MRFVETVDKINGLPVGFKEVEYLESTGTQWIDTGINVDTSTDEIKLYYQLIDTALYKWFFGEYDTNARIGLGSGDGTDKRNFLYQQPATKVSDTLMYNKQHLFEINSNGGFLDGTKIVNYASFASTSSIYLFNLNIDSPSDYRCKSKIWKYEHKRNGVLIRELIPCLDNEGIPCMYDLVEKKAYYNQGTGEFSYGREMHPVEYLESTGTQYIDTGILPKPTSTYKSTFQLTNITTTSGAWFCVFGSVESNNSTFTELFLPRSSGGGDVNQILAGNHNSSYIRVNYPWAVNTKYSFEMTPTVVLVNEVSQGSISVDSSITCSHSIYLFARHEHNDAVGYNVSAKIYSFTIYEGNTLVQDLIPAIDENNVPYMFDRVTHKAYLNVGTGEFFYGNPVASNKGKIRFPMTQHEKSRLPLGFREVEYLESTGTQWIDTGVYPTQLIEAEYICAVTGSISNVDSHLFGSRLSASSEAFDLAYINTSPNGTEKFRFIHGTITTQETTTSVTASQLTNPHTYYMSGTSFKVDGVEKMSFTTASFTGTYSLWLFGVNSAGSLHNQVRAQRVYKCKLWNNGVLIRDFIPCIDPLGHACMYDLVGKKAYYNQGTGADFSYGRQIIPVEYLESTGTQYIDTGYAFQDDFSWEISFDGITKGTTLFGGRTSSARTAILYQKSASQGIETTCPIAGMTGDQTPFQLTDLSAGRHKVKMSVAQNKGSVWVDDVQVYNNTSFSGTYISGTTQTIFADNFGTSVSEYTSSKVYSLRMWQNSSIVKDYTPAIDENNVPFMFDHVTHTAYLNAGTGTFLYGNLLKQNKVRIVLPHPIPLIYEPVEYLESTGTQYINTGVTVNASTKLSLDFQMTNITSGTNGIFGASAGQTLQFLTQTSQSGFVFQWTPNSIKCVGVKDTERHTADLDIPNQNLSVDSTSTSISDFTFDYPTGNIMLMANGHTSVYGRMKTYGCKIYNGSTLLRDLVPVIRRADKKPGFYCKATKQFFTNAGTGEFLYG